jgi:DNA repair protein RadA/Sms
VLQQRAGVKADGRDVFVSTVGGARVTEPAGDLAIALSIASASKQIAVPTDVVAIGEIGLAGELRRVRDLDRRLAEAARLGFSFAVVPAEHKSGARPARTVEGMQVFEATDLGNALRVLDLGGTRQPHVVAVPNDPRDLGY